MRTHTIAQLHVICNTLTRTHAISLSYTHTDIFEEYSLHPSFLVDSGTAYLD